MSEEKSAETTPPAARRAAARGRQECDHPGARSLEVSPSDRRNRRAGGYRPVSIRDVDEPQRDAADPALTLAHNLYCRRKLGFDRVLDC